MDTSPSSPVLTILLVGVGVFVGTALLVLSIGLIQRAVLNAMKGPLSKRVSERYGDSPLRVAFGASSFGLESLGVTQLRGNGALVLAEKEVTFFQFLPSRDFVIPLASITETRLVKSHLGKATPFNLVKIHFTNDGIADSLAVFVRGASEWKRAIDERRGS